MDERKGLAFRMERRAGASLRVAVEELRQPGTFDGTGSRHALPAVEQEFHDTATGCFADTGGPFQNLADGMSATEGVERAPLLAASAGAAMPEFGKSHAAAVGVIEDGCDLHADRTFPVSGS